MIVDRILPLLALASLGWLGCRAQPAKPPLEDALIVIPGDAPTNQSSCSDRLEFALDTMNELVDAANGSCLVDDDCTLVYAETHCQGACQVAILDRRVDAFREGQKAIDSRACTDYPQDGCEYATPTCLSVEVTCVSGRCATREARQSP